MAERPEDRACVQCSATIIWLTPVPHGGGTSTTGLCRCSGDRYVEWLEADRAALTAEVNRIRSYARRRGIKNADLNRRYQDLILQTRGERETITQYGLALQAIESLVPSESFIDDAKHSHDAAAMRCASAWSATKDVLAPLPKAHMEKRGPNA